MEFAIGAIIGVVIGILFKRRKPRKPELTPVEAGQRRKLRDADEIVTVIVPTINSDK